MNEGQWEWIWIVLLTIGHGKNMWNFWVHVQIVKTLRSVYCEIIRSLTWKKKIHHLILSDVYIYIWQVLFSWRFNIAFKIYILFISSCKTLAYILLFELHECPIWMPNFCKRFSFVFFSFLHKAISYYLYLMICTVHLCRFLFPFNSWPSAWIQKYFCAVFTRFHRLSQT